MKYNLENFKIYAVPNIADIELLNVEDGLKGKINTQYRIMPRESGVCCVILEYNKHLFLQLDSLYIEYDPLNNKHIEQELTAKAFKLKHGLLRTLHIDINGNFVESSNLDFVNPQVIENNSQRGSL